MKHCEDISDVLVLNYFKHLQRSEQYIMPSNWGIIRVAVDRCFICCKSVCVSRIELFHSCHFCCYSSNFSCHWSNTVTTMKPSKQSHLLLSPEPSPTPKLQESLEKPSMSWLRKIFLFLASVILIFVVAIEMIAFKSTATAFPFSVCALFCCAFV